MNFGYIFLGVKLSDSLESNCVGTDSVPYVTGKEILSVYILLHVKSGGNKSERAFFLEVTD